MNAANLKTALAKWLHDYPAIFTATEVAHGMTLTEIDTHKSRTILYPEVKQWRRKANPEGLGDYINLVFEDERELVLCHAGFAFTPSYVAGTPPRPLPPVVCFHDYYRLRGHLEHLYRDRALDQMAEMLNTVMQCLAILAGAKLVGLECATEERELEPVLNWLEKQSG